MQPLRNAPQVARNIGNTILNKPGFFRDQSLILASLALVFSRIFVANVSALRSQGTPEGPYRYRESIRTDMRELGGFTLGFGLLRAFQFGLKKGLKKWLGVTEERLDDGYSPKRIWKDLTGKTRPTPINLKLAWDNPAHIKENKFTWLAQKTADVFDAPGLKTLKDKATAKVKVDGLPEAEKVLAKNKAFIVDGIYKVAPILISSIPTIALAGYLLERVTRDHSEKIVDAVSKRFSSADTPPKPTVATLPVPSSPVSSLAASPQFGMRPMVSPYRASSNLFAAPRL